MNIPFDSYLRRSLSSLVTSWSPWSLRIGCSSTCDRALVVAPHGDCALVLAPHDKSSILENKKIKLSLYTNILIAFNIEFVLLYYLKENYQFKRISSWQ